MKNLKHNQPQMSAVLFNQKNILSFSIQPLLPTTSPRFFDEGWGQKHRNAKPECLQKIL